MWNIPTNLLCRKHLLGEHLEMHMFRTAVISGKRITGFINNGLVETHNISKRHDELVEEMNKRGYNHKTPMDTMITQPRGCVDIKKNILILRERCEECRKLQTKEPVVTQEELAKHPSLLEYINKRRQSNE